MAWKDTAKIGTLSAAFGKQPATNGNMHAPAAMLHPKTMKPMGLPSDPGQKFGNSGGMGNPMAGGLGGPTKGSVQSPAQHASVEKAAQTSAMRRKKAF